MFTGVQLEVGSLATPFEHRNQTEEFNRCRRYFQKFAGYSDHYFFGISRAEGTTVARSGINIPIPMRAAPTVACPNNRVFKDGTNSSSTTTPTVTYQSSWKSEQAMYTIDFSGHSGLLHNNIYLLMSNGTADLGLTLDSEL